METKLNLTEDQKKIISSRRDYAKKILENPEVKNRKDQTVFLYWKGYYLALGELLFESESESESE